MQEFLATFQTLATVMLTYINLGSAIEKEKRKKFASKICHSLRAIYFSEHGVKMFLQKIANGEPVSEKEFTQLFESFEGEEKNVQNALRNLQDMSDLRLAMEDFQVLDKIAYNKIQVREEILREFGQYRGKNSKGRILRAQEIVEQLDELNKAIAAIEGRLRLQ